MDTRVIVCVRVIVCTYIYAALSMGFTDLVRSPRVSSVSILRFVFLHSHPYLMHKYSFLRTTLVIHWVIELTLLPRQFFAVNIRFHVSDEMRGPCLNLLLVAVVLTKCEDSPLIRTKKAAIPVNALSWPKVTS